MKTGFLDKLIDRLDRLDTKSLQSYFLRLAQERGLLETIFQSIQEGVIVIDENGQLNYANKAAEELLGISLKSTDNRDISRYLREIDWDHLLKLGENESPKLVTREIEIAYPEHRFVSFYVVPLPAEKNNSKGMVIILRDITYDRKQEANILQSERWNAVKLLAASVAHEIGNPLNALNIHLQLLDREISALSKPENNTAGSQENDIPHLHELVKVARNEVSRLDVILTQFLHAIRPAIPNLTTSRIEDLLKETLVLLKQEIENRAIDVTVDCSEPIPDIKVDRDQIKQVFFNIIKNAFEAMPDRGSLKITFSVRKDFVAIAFQDSGEGIKQEDFGHLFKPYHTTKPDGTGLGLMIVQRIVQDHGGQIELASKPDHGTSIVILLPLSERRIRLLPSSESQKTGYGNTNTSSEYIQQNITERR